MLSLPLLAPQISEALAAELQDRGAATVARQAGAWDGVWRETAARSGDMLAWALVAFFLLCMGVFAGCILALRMRPRRPTPEQLLIEEVQRDEDRLAGTAPDEGRQSWERPADWWKNPD
jgi:hypothetical protein